MPSELPLPVLDAVAVAACERRLLRDAACLEVGWLARLVAARMGERLSIIKHQPVRILDASGWLGQGGEVLQQHYPKAERLTLESQTEAEGRHRAGAPSWWAPWRRSEPQARLHWRHHTWPGEVDLLWSNLHLHTRVDPSAEIEQWHRAVKPGGFVMFSTLGPGSFRELQSWHQAMGLGPATIPFVDMHDHGDMLVRAGFADPVMDQESIQLTWADARAALRDLRALGANAHPARHAGCRTPRWQGRLEAAWNAHRSANGRLSLTVEVAYGHAFRVDRGDAQPREGRITIEELRSTARTANSRRSNP